MTPSYLLKQLDCRYVLGLSATPFRRDEQLAPVIPWFIGPVRHHIDRSDLADRLIRRWSAPMLFST
jgi:superfamily II DNA or RNA helicase